MYDPGLRNHYRRLSCIRPTIDNTTPKSFLERERRRNGSKSAHRYRSQDFSTGDPYSSRYSISKTPDYDTSGGNFRNYNRSSHLEPSGGSLSNFNATNESPQSYREDVFQSNKRFYSVDNLVENPMINNYNYPNSSGYERTNGHLSRPTGCMSGVEGRQGHWPHYGSAIQLDRDSSMDDLHGSRTNTMKGEVYNSDLRRSHSISEKIDQFFQEVAEREQGIIEEQQLRAQRAEYRLRPPWFRSLSNNSSQGSRPASRKGSNQTLNSASSRKTSRNSNNPSSNRTNTSIRLKSKRSGLGSRGPVQPLHPHHDQHQLQQQLHLQQQQFHQQQQQQQQQPLHQRSQNTGRIPRSDSMNNLSPPNLAKSANTRLRKTLSRPVSAVRSRARPPSARPSSARPPSAKPPRPSSAISPPIRTSQNSTRPVSGVPYRNQPKPRPASAVPYRPASAVPYRPVSAAPARLKTRPNTAVPKNADLKNVESRLRYNKNYQPPRRRKVVDPTEENEQEVHETEPDKGYEDDFESGGEEEETDSEAEGIKQQQQAWLLEQAERGQARLRALQNGVQLHHQATKEDPGRLKQFQGQRPPRGRELLEKDSSRDSAYGYSAESRITTREPTPDQGRSSVLLRRKPFNNLRHKKKQTVRINDDPRYSSSEYEKDKAHLEFLQEVTSHILRKGIYSEKGIRAALSHEMKWSDYNLSRAESEKLISNLKHELGVDFRNDPAAGLSDILSNKNKMVPGEPNQTNMAASRRTKMAAKIRKQRPEGSDLENISESEIAGILRDFSLDSDMVEDIVSIIREEESLHESCDSPRSPLGVKPLPQSPTKNPRLSPEKENNAKVGLELFNISFNAGTTTNSNKQRKKSLLGRLVGRQGSSSSIGGLATLQDGTQFNEEKNEKRNDDEDDDDDDDGDDGDDNEDDADDNVDGQEELSEYSSDKQESDDNSIDEEDDEEDEDDSDKEEEEYKEESEIQTDED